MVHRVEVDSNYTSEKLIKDIKDVEGLWLGYIIIYVNNMGGKNYAEIFESSFDELFVWAKNFWI